MTIRSRRVASALKAGACIALMFIPSLQSANTSIPLAAGFSVPVIELQGAHAESLRKGWNRIRRQGEINVNHAAKHVSNAITNGIEEVDQAAHSVGDFAEKHKKELIIAAAVVAAVYTACATGCDVLVSVGGATAKVGSFELAAGAGAGAAAAAAANKSDEQQKPAASSPQQSQQTAQSGADQATPSIVAAKPLVNPDSLPWERHSLLLVPSKGNGDSGDDDVTDAVKDGVIAGLKEGITTKGPDSLGTSVFEPLGAGLTVFFTPSKVDPSSVWNEDMEANARLNEMLRPSIGDSLGVPLVPKDLTITPPGPEFKPVSPPPSTRTLTTVEEIQLKSRILGELTGLSGDEVERRVRAGMASDIAEQNRKAQEADAEKYPRLIEDE